MDPHKICCLFRAIKNDEKFDQFGGKIEVFFRICNKNLFNLNNLQINLLFGRNTKKYLRGAGLGRVLGF